MDAVPVAEVQRGGRVVGAAGGVADGGAQFGGEGGGEPEPRDFGCVQVHGGGVGAQEVEV